jgi:nucleotide-binding universal stress UspA family protein
MRLKKILFPTDFSHCGDEALALATSLAKDAGAKLLIVHVAEPPMAYGTGHLYYGPIEPTQEQLWQMLCRVIPNAPDVEYEHRVLFGNPAQTIVSFADEENVDLIVIGTHGRTGLFRMLMGSVAESVVRHATCPVATFKHPKHQPVE